PRRHSRPLATERAPEAPAVCEVRAVPLLVARQVEKLPRFPFPAQLAEGLAGVVVSDLETHLIGAYELGPAGEQRENEACRVAEPSLKLRIGLAAPISGVDREGAEARRGRRNDQTLGIPKALREACIQFVGGMKVPGIGRYQPAAPLPLRKTDLVPGGLRDSLQRDRRLGQDAVDHARREDRA